MENGVQALIMAFGVITLVIALSISISLLGQVNACSDAILNNADRENDYIYISDGIASTERKVGIETIIPTIYRAYDELYEVRFLDSSGGSFELYKNPDGTVINTINSQAVNAQEVWADKEEFLQYLIYGELDNDKYLPNGKLDETKIKNNYDNYTFNSDGLYKRLSDKTITEYLGEYSEDELKGSTEESNVPDANKTKKRIIVYVVE